MTFIKGRTAGVGFPRLNTRNWNKEREGEKIELVSKVSNPTISYICFCNITASLLNLLLRGFRCLKHFRRLEGFVGFFEELTNELLDNFYLN